MIAIKEYIKIGIAAMIVLIVTLGTIVQLNSPTLEVSKESKKAFSIIETAFKENRDLTEYDLMELKEFKKLRKDREEKYYDGKASRKEEKDAVLLHAVGKVVDLYEEGLENVPREYFFDKYNDAKILVE